MAKKLIHFLAILGLLAAPASSHRALSATPEEEEQRIEDDIKAQGDALKVYALDDAEIADKCRLSIAAHYQMVDYTDLEGNTTRVTKCEKTYKTMRDYADKYAKALNEGYAEIKAAKSLCDSVNSQANCLNAGKESNQTAEKVHLDLAVVATDTEGVMETLH